MSVALAQTRVRPDDNGYDVVMIGINYASGKVVVRIRFDSGEERDINYEGASLTTLRSGVPQFAGLRLAIEQFIAATEPNLAGSAT